MAIAYIENENEGKPVSTHLLNVYKCSQCSRTIHMLCACVNEREGGRFTEGNDKTSQRNEDEEQKEFSTARDGLLQFVAELVVAIFFAELVRRRCSSFNVSPTGFVRELKNYVQLNE